MRELLLLDRCTAVDWLFSAILKCLFVVFKIVFYKRALWPKVLKYSEIIGAKSGTISGPTVSMMPMVEWRPLKILLEKSWGGEVFAIVLFFTK